MTITAVSPKGYDNQQPRRQKAPGALAAAGSPAGIDRIIAAQYNTFEACTYMLCTFYVGASLSVPKLLFAKLASLILALRLVYPVAYYLDLDLLRTQIWLTGLYVC